MITFIVPRTYRRSLTNVSFFLSLEVHKRNPNAQISSDAGDSFHKGLINVSLVRTSSSHCTNPCLRCYYSNNNMIFYYSQYGQRFVDTQTHQSCVSLWNMSFHV